MRSHNFNIYIFLLGLMTVLAGCSRVQKASFAATQSGTGTSAQTPASGKEGPAQAPASGKQAPAPTPAPGPATAALKPENLPEVVAEVNGQSIKKADLIEQMRTVETQMGLTGQIPADKKGEFIRSVLDEMISQRLLVQDAQAKKIGPSAEETEKQLGDFKKRFPDAAAFTKALKDEGLTEEKLKQKIQEQLTLKQYVDTVVVSKVTISDADAQKFYDANKDKMKEPEQIKASHILIRVDPKADDNTKKTAREKAADILKRAKANEDFATLAKTYSEDPGSKENGGNLDYFGKGQMVPEFEKAAWALQANQISEIVETPFGLHIIKLAERKPEKVVPFDTAKEQIKSYLKRDAVMNNLQTIVGELKAKGKVKVLI